MTEPSHLDAAALEVDWGVLREYGIPFPRFEVCHNFEDARSFLQSSASQLICLKGITHGHKTDRGLVARGIRSEAQLVVAWTDLSQAGGRLGLSTDLFAQEEVPGGQEVIVGGRRDEAFGPVVLLGIGGTRAEEIAQGHTKLVPLSSGDAGDLVRSVLGRSDARLEEIVEATARLLMERGHVREMDINPVILSPDGPFAVDLRLIQADSQINPDGRAAAMMREAGGEAAAILRLLEPRSVAVVGASRNETKAGGRVLRSLFPFRDQVKIYPVNRREQSIGGVETVASIGQLPNGIDVAVVATAAGEVESALNECADRGVTSAVVLASGFREAGGGELESRIRRLARDRGIRVCGVNSIGVIGDFPLTFSHCVDYPTPLAGSVSYLTQSGALGGSLLVRSWSQGLGTARFVCVGNQTDLSMADFLRFLANDPKTKTVGVFLEGTEDGRDLLAAAREVTGAGKGLAVLKAGTTPTGAAAAASHTGTLAGLDRIYDDLLGEVGAVRVEDLPELVGVCQVLDWLPAPSGNRVGIIATSGGACSLLADEALGGGLHVPGLGTGSESAVKAILPSYATTGNPIDTTGDILRDPGMLGLLLQQLLGAPEFDILIVALSTLMGDTSERIADDIIGAVGSKGKPVVVGWSLPESVCPEAFRRLRGAHIPTFDSYSAAVRAAAALVKGTAQQSR